MNCLLFHCLKLLLLTTLVCLPSIASAPPPEGKTMPEESAADLAKRYKQCRKDIRTGNADVQAQLRNWKGPMHEIMAILGERLTAGRRTSSEVISLMGPPDETIAGPSVHDGHEIQEGETHLVYWWRGGHDHLYFVVREGVVESADWYYADE
jgi:hypothetical protein